MPLMQSRSLTYFAIPTPAVRDPPEGLGHDGADAPVGVHDREGDGVHAASRRKLRERLRRKPVDGKSLEEGSYFRPQKSRYDEILLSIGVCVPRKYMWAKS
jgi:hypothetical protein